MVSVAIIPKNVGIPPAELALVASAINLQVTRDLAKPWNVQATVAAFPDDREPLARGFVPVYVVADTGGSDGIHQHPDDKTLLALVRYAANARWSLAASHEILELLVDPTLRRMLPGPLPGEPAVTVQYLVEICDPCEGPDYAYHVDAAHGVYVSDFCLPSYYAVSSPAGGPYTFRDNLPGPGTIVTGGRVTWQDATGNFFQRTSVGGPERVIGNLTAEQIFGDADDRSNLRGAIDRHAFQTGGRRALRPLSPRSKRKVDARQVSQAVKRMDRVLEDLIGKSRPRAGRRRLPSRP